MTAEQVDEGEHDPLILAMTSDEAEDLRTLIGYVTEDGRGYEDFVGFMHDEEFIDDDQHDLLDRRSTTPEAHALLEKLIEDRSTDHAWPAAMRLQRTFVTKSIETKES